ncbi:MAG: hypothetical protein PHE27_06695 [Alphaproteobacteria bacterium]|nr:hypothetical protein [Alphaproteobacteria bacterium]
MSNDPLEESTHCATKNVLIVGALAFAAGAAWNLTHGGSSTLSTLCVYEAVICSFFADKHNRICVAEKTISDAGERFDQSKYNSKGYYSAVAAAGFSGLAAGSFAAEIPRVVPAILAGAAIVASVAARRFWNKAAIEATTKAPEPGTPNYKNFSQPEIPVQPK